MTTTSNGFLADIRPCARAVILRNREVLVQVKSKPGRGDYLSLPGGKQEPGETLTECVIRECEEEIGATVIVDRLLHVAETFRDKPDGTRHQLDMLFACNLPEHYVPQLGPHPDPSQIATAWVPVEQAVSRLSPAFGPCLGPKDEPVYLGLCNV
ncbi:MAG: NUDIX domain-containing protein [Pseudomonadota bacterium]